MHICALNALRIVLVILGAFGTYSLCRQAALEPTRAIDAFLSCGVVVLSEPAVLCHIHAIDHTLPLFGTGHASGGSNE